MSEAGPGAPAQPWAPKPLDGIAGAQVVFRSDPSTVGLDWWHLKHSAQTETALRSDPDIPPDLTDALLERDTQPRVHAIDGHTLLILRGINHAQGAEPEDMISIRLAISGRQVVSVELRRLRQIDRLIAECRAGRTPENPGALLCALVSVLRADVEPVLDELETDVARLEKRLLRSERALGRAERAALSDTRQDAIMLHRYIAPQGQAVAALTRLKPDWLTERRVLKSEAEAFRRIASDLEAVRDRAQIVAEEAALVASERMNRTILLLSAVSVVFLPITALTGLLGVNLAGIPFAEDPASFPIFGLLLVAVGALAAWLAMRLLR
ncbi:MAG: CorA family divalent cation transporter [Paracoccaceae bacterium]